MGILEVWSKNRHALAQQIQVSALDKLSLSVLGEFLTDP
jgi:hypothetical protein